MAMQVPLPRGVWVYFLFVWVFFPARRQAGKQNPRRRAVIDGDVAALVDVEPSISFVDIHKPPSTHELTLLLLSTYQLPRA